MTDLTTPVGRIVYGHPSKGRPKTNAQTKQPVLKDGKQVTQWSFGVAFSKADFIAHIWPAMEAERIKIFPNGAPPGFAYKMKDGDGIDSKGKPYSSREGYAGCYVVAFSQEAFAPRVVKLNGGVYSDVPEVGIKTGDYVRVATSIVQHGANPNAPGSQAGLYVNPNMVEIVGYGTEIVSGPDAETAFGGQSVALPPGASAMPMGGTGALPTGNPPGMPTAAPQGMAPAGYAAPQGMAPAGYAAPQSFPSTLPPGSVPAAVPLGANPAVPQMPGMPTPGPIAFPGNPAPAPAADFVTNATGQTPRLLGYNQQTGQPIYG